MASKAPSIVQKAVDKAITRSMGEIDINLMPITPVKSAFLRGELHMPHFAPFQGRIGSNLPYALRVHDLKAPGVPYRNPSLNKNAVAGFLTVAVNQSESKIQDAFNRALEDITNDIAQLSLGFTL